MKAVAAPEPASPLLSRPCVFRRQYSGSRTPAVLTLAMCCEGSPVTCWVYVGCVERRWDREKKVEKQHGAASSLWSEQEASSPHSCPPRSGNPGVCLIAGFNSARAHKPPALRLKG